MQLCSQVDLDWTCLETFCKIKTLHYVFLANKETTNIEIWCSNIEVGNLKIGCFLMTIGYYTWHKNISKQRTFKFTTSIMEQLINWLRLIFYLYSKLRLTNIKIENFNFWSSNVKVRTYCNRKLTVLDRKLKFPRLNLKLKNA